MNDKNELKQLIKEREDIGKQIVQLQRKEEDILIRIRRVKRERKRIGTPWKK